MFEPKNLIVNCDILDTRRMKAEDYDKYERIVFNSDIMIVSEESKTLLARLPITSNQDMVLALGSDEPLHCKTVNGRYEIGSMPVQPGTVLTVNGALTIRPDAAETLKSFRFISVNGAVTCPDDLAAALPELSVNGAQDFYPGGCIPLEKRFTLDAVFPLRAKRGAKYYAKTVILKDPAVDLGKLLEKDVTFYAKRLITIEQHVEACAALFDERTEFLVAPEGLALLTGDVTLDAQLLKKHGKRLYVYGDVTLGDGFEAVERLIVKGDVKLKKAQREAFLALDAEYDELKTEPDARVIRNSVGVRIDRTLLESVREPDGVFVQNAASVAIDADVPPALILEKLRIENCAGVRCTREQESAVAAVAKNCAKIGQGEGEDEKASPWDWKHLLKNAMDTKVVNADMYEL